MKALAWTGPVCGLTLVAWSASTWPTPFLTMFAWPVYVAAAALIVTAALAVRFRRLGAAAALAAFPLLWCAQNGLSDDAVAQLATHVSMAPRVLGEGMRNLGLALFLAGTTAAAFGWALFFGQTTRERGAIALAGAGVGAAVVGQGFLELAEPLLAVGAMKLEERLALPTVLDDKLDSWATVGIVAAAVVVIALSLEALRRDRSVGAVSFGAALALVALAGVVSLPIVNFQASPAPWTVDPLQVKKDGVVLTMPEAQWSRTTEAPQGGVKQGLDVLADRSLSVGDLRRIVGEPSGGEQSLNILGRTDDEPWPMVCEPGWSAICQAIDLTRLSVRRLKISWRLPDPPSDANLRPTPPEDLGRFGRPAHAGDARAGTLIRHGQPQFLRSDRRDLVIYDVADRSELRDVETGTYSSRHVFKDDTTLEQVFAEMNAVSYLLLNAPTNEELGHFAELEPPKRWTYSTRIEPEVRALWVNGRVVSKISGRGGSATLKSIEAMLRKVEPKLVACSEGLMRRTGPSRTRDIDFGLDIPASKDRPVRFQTSTPFVNSSCIQTAVASLPLPRPPSGASVEGTLREVHTATEDVSDATDAAEQEGASTRRPSRRER